jgi:hypothetical protein
MGTRLSQVAPVFGNINMQVGFGPENFGFESAARAHQCNVAALNMRIDATSTTDTLNVASYKPSLRTAFTDESQPISVS